MTGFDRSMEKKCNLNKVIKIKIPELDEITKQMLRRAIGIEIKYEQTTSK